MEVSEGSRGKKMREYNARLAKIVEGLSEAQVEEILGRPTAVMSRQRTDTPSDFFRQIGSMFRFPDEQTDVIWVYVHPHRPRVRNYVGFKAGKVLSTWRETVTQERWAELQR